MARDFDAPSHNFWTYVPPPVHARVWFGSLTDTATTLAATRRAFGRLTYVPPPVHARVSFGSLTDTATTLAATRRAFGRLCDRGVLAEARAVDLQVLQMC
jgi:hypothetical protein